jgi:hypothetical protein
MEASYGGTRARSAYELGEGMSEPDMKRGRSPNGDRGWADGSMTSLAAVFAAAQTICLRQV